MLAKRIDVAPEALGEPMAVLWEGFAARKVALTPAQLSMLLEGIDWRAPQRTWRPLVAG